MVLLIAHTLTGDDVRQWMHSPSLNRVADFAACTNANAHNHTYCTLTYEPLIALVISLLLIAQVWTVLSLSFALREAIVSQSLVIF